LWVATPHTPRDILVGNCKAFPTMHRSYSKEHLIKVLYMDENRKKLVIPGAISAKRDVPYCNFYAWSERGHNFQQFSCRTYALTLYGSKLWSMRYSTLSTRATGKITVGSYLKVGSYDTYLWY
jgi:hypothetical protein